MIVYQGFGPITMEIRLMKLTDYKCICYRQSRARPSHQEFLFTSSYARLKS